VSNSTLSFSNNAAAKYGAGIYIDLTSTMSFEQSNINFLNNSAQAQGGALYISSYSRLSFNASSIVFNTNRAIDGSGIYIEKSSISFNYSTISFKNNKTLSSGNGGAVFVSYSTISFRNSIVFFEDNSAARGGALYMTDSSASFSFSNAVFSKNYVNLEGGALYLNNSIISFYGSSIIFTSNSAQKGGALYADGSIINLSAIGGDIVFQYNKALIGGDIYLLLSQLNLMAEQNSNIFLQNGIYASASSINISGGGNIYLSSVNYFQRISSFSVIGSYLETDFSSLTYELSSPIYVLQSTISLKNPYFKSNTASGGSGGALYIDRSLASFGDGAKFVSNTAFSSGGAVYMNYSSVDFKKVDFTNNFSLNGAAIYAIGSTISFFAESGDIIFSRNVGNKDIYLDGANNRVYFYSAAPNKIELNLGISALRGDIIEHSGNGELILKGDINLRGELVLKGGKTSFRADNINISSLTIKNAQYQIIPPDFEAGGYNFAVNDVKIISYVDDLQANNATFGFNLYFNNKAMAVDAIRATNTVKIEGENNKTNIEAFGFLAEITTNSILPLIFSSSYTYPSDSDSPFYDDNGEIIWHLETNDNRRLFYSLNFSSNSGLQLHLSTAMPITVENLTYNQTEVKKLLNLIKDNESLKEVRSKINLMTHKSVEKSLDELSGIFLVNSLVLAAQRNDADRIFNRLLIKRPGEADKEVNVWVQFDMENNNSKGEESQVADIQYSKYEWQTGYDINNTDRFIFGMYFAQSIDSIKQDLNKAEIMDNGAGIYLAVYNLNTTVLFNLNASYASFSTQRDISFMNKKSKADFGAILARSAVEVELKLYDGKTVSIKPFIGARGVYMRNEDINEKDADFANLSIAPQSYTRADAFVGLNLNARISDFDFYAKAFSGHILMGDSFGYDINFSQSKDSGIMNIENSPINGSYYGVGAGAAYSFENYTKIFFNIENNINSDAKAGYFFQFGIEISLVSKSKVKERREAKINNDNTEQRRDFRARAALRQIEIDLKSELNKKVDSDKSQDLRAASGRRANRNMKAFRLPAALFEPNSFDLTPYAFEEIKQLAETIKVYNYARVTVEGHTDSTGDEQHNMELSQSRAIMVYYHLYNEGVENIEYVGFGSLMPIASNDTPEGREQNRRVEIFVEMQ
ncbi:MAG: OmpA family protein, partial [Elusimicrobiota bacterium]|jgi:predicted outer membrane repeat protein|nr:OmpA family protein [Elusimicrobiota bacterium]